MRITSMLGLGMLGLVACAAPVLNPVASTEAVANETLGTPQRGQASFYHPERFTGRPMANGEPFDPGSNSAAHRTLPLGTVAEVTNLENGESRTVVIEDRGPYIRGRIIDLSPRVADELGMRESGVAPVEVRPVGREENSGRND
jgi:rare lipoprotein A